MFKSPKMDTLWILMDTFQKYPLTAAYRKLILWILSLSSGLKNNNNKNIYPLPISEVSIVSIDFRQLQRPIRENQTQSIHQSIHKLSIKVSSEMIS